VLATSRLTGHSIESYASSIRSGGVARDAIPALTEPRFWEATEADGFLDADDIVFGLLEGTAPRAYPQRIMVWHEVVNDAIDGLWLTISYCPLVGDVLAFERGGTEFGVSGMTVNSNLILYDRTSDTCFPQMLAVGVVGPHTGAALVERSIVWTTWRRWRERFPNTLVLSTDTGINRDYTRDPYGQYKPIAGYYERDVRPMFKPMHEDDRYPPKAVFLAARTETNAVGVDLDMLRQHGRVEIVADGEEFTAVYDHELDTGYIVRGVDLPGYRIGGNALPRVAWDDSSRHEPVNAFHCMWFALVGFYPNVFVAG
jgi:hypothetical protein